MGISGLSGTGKSTVGGAVARRRRAVWLSVDDVEDALLGIGLPSDWTTGVAAYEAVAAAAAENLRLGHVVIVDAVNDSEPARDTWRRAAEAASAPIVFVLLTPPSEQEHRRRLRERSRRLSHQSEPTWEQVQARARRYEEWRVRGRDDVGEEHGAQDAVEVGLFKRRPRADDGRLIDVAHPHLVVDPRFQLSGSSRNRRSIHGCILFTAECARVPLRTGLASSPNPQ